ncbi:hypothetical protein AB0D99_19125 [Streptomyces sp. NPDC047971]|uniref:hypothetical protein n=1 Tax=Streptomyces sp. NPDC047971 TaxID=3154499 RepID=UPI0033E51DB9
MAEVTPGRLPDDDILRAVELHLSGRGTQTSLSAPGAARITWHSILDGEVVRSLETRSEAPREKPGRVDLSDLPEYTDLAGHDIPPPSDPAARETLELVRRGSVRQRTCACGNGRWRCQLCQGSKRRRCEPTRPCTACSGTDPCVRCHGTGRPQGRPPANRGARTSDERVDCVRCDKPAAACPACLGRGTAKCPDCAGKGSVTCEDCGGKGTVEHAACGGTGSLTTWTGAVVERRGDKEPVRMPEQRPPVLVRQRAEGAGRWAEAVLDEGGKLPADLDPAHVAALTPRLARRDGEVARRVVLRHLPLARVEVPADPDRVFYVFPGRTAEIEVFPYLSPQRIRHVLTLGSAAVGLVLLGLFLVLTLTR